MAKPTKPKKRIGRPTKAPNPGERVALGFRVTPAMKQRLEAAAIRMGRSLSQELELRLERSFINDRHLMLSNLLLGKDELIIYISEEEIISVSINPDQKKRLIARMREEREDFDK